ncbi:MAG: N-acetylglucosamine-6-phosphate deacetylase [Tannerellaceae bacterium]|jgi:N-acetylglucosamine-6-phosphate deacetylase|nr:N-acetylglucosamine-6-phosphate deacetylase [Tannerellaceae bacterium]
MKTTYTKIINGRIITPSGILNDAHLLFAEGKIIEISRRNTEIEGATVIDARGNYVAPGCIDTHVHGGGGHDFSEATSEAFLAAAYAHAHQGGTTAIYPTIAAASPDTFAKAIETCKALMDSPHDGARIMGLHLEGNYLNPIMRGAQDPAHIYPPRPDEYRAILGHGHCIRRWSAAPEIEGALAFGRYAAERGVVVSIAHTTAGYAQVKAAFEAGYRHVTHFYNAMTGVHREGVFKREGTIESIYLMDGITVELVADGIHVPPAILRLVYKMMGAGRIALVTDSMSAAAHTTTGEIYDGRVVIEDGVCKLADRSAIAGSIATMIHTIRTMTQQAGVPLTDAVRMASETPATIMSINDRKGSLAPGKDADIIIFDPTFTIHWHSGHGPSLLKYRS